MRHENARCKGLLHLSCPLVLGSPETEITLLLTLKKAASVLFFVVPVSCLALCSLSVCSSAFVRAIHNTVMKGQDDTSVPLTPCYITSAVAFQCSGQLLSDPRHFSTSDNSFSFTPPVSDLIWTARHTEPHGKHRHPPHTRWFIERQSAASILHTGKKGGREDLLTVVWMKSRIRRFYFNRTYHQWIICVFVNRV